VTDRWDREQGMFVKDALVDAFLFDLEVIFKKHGMCLEPLRGFEVRKRLLEDDLMMLRASDIGYD
jgi:hypothetical protein